MVIKDLMVGRYVYFKTFVLGSFTV